LLDLYVVDMHSDMTDLQTTQLKNTWRTDLEKRKSEVWCAVQRTDAFLRGTSNSIFGNAFYQNLGNGRFVEVSDKLGVETYWPWGVSVGDLNADGYEDVLVTAGMGYPFRYAINSVLLNEHGERFFDAEFLLGVEPRLNGRQQKRAFTLDCSGADKGHPLCAGVTGLASANGALSSRSSAMFDLDDDGDLDIVTNEMNDRPQVLVSNLSEMTRIHYVKIKLTGTTSNRDGLGATVRVHAGAKVYTRYHDGKSGYLSQSSMPIYVGLGEAANMDRIEVLWPSGKQQVVTKDLKMNSLLNIKEATE
jgi:hypothetical protein